MQQSMDRKGVESNGLVGPSDEPLGSAGLGVLGKAILGSRCLDGLGAVGSAGIARIGKRLGCLDNCCLGNLGEVGLGGLG